MDTRTIRLFMIAGAGAMLMLGASTCSRQPIARGQGQVTARQADPAVDAEVASESPSSLEDVHPGPPPVIPPDRYSAALVEGGGTLHAEWSVDSQGAIASTSFISWNARLEAASADRPEQQTLPVLLVVGGHGASPPPMPAGRPDGLYLTRAAITGQLQLPGRVAADVLIQCYGMEPDECSTLVLWSTRQGADRFAIVLDDEGWRSPAGEWLAPTFHDIDGDGLVDLSFLAQGVDCCDQGPCPLDWVEVFMTNTHTLGSFRDRVLLDTATIGAMCARTSDPFCDPAELRWQVAGRPSGLHISARGPGGRRSWVLTLDRAAGTLSLGAAVPASASSSSSSSPLQTSSD